MLQGTASDPLVEGSCSCTKLPLEQAPLSFRVLKIKVPKVFCSLGGRGDTSWPLAFLPHKLDWLTPTLYHPPSFLSQ